MSVAEQIKRTVTHRKDYSNSNVKFTKHSPRQKYHGRKNKENIIINNQLYYQYSRCNSTNKKKLKAFWGQNKQFVS